MDVLPDKRVSISRPFTNTGLDFAGRFDIKSVRGRGSTTTKGYVCVFLCFATKVIHLEAVSELTSNAFLAAFSRFVSRRGCSPNVYSDNGKNFVGAAKTIAQDSLKQLSPEPKQHIPCIMSFGISFHQERLIWEDSGSPQ